MAGAPLVKKSLVAYIGYTSGIAIILVAICYWKGEKPGWRWGDSE